MIPDKCILTNIELYREESTAEYMCIHYIGLEWSSIRLRKVSTHTA